jgi:hypothetical protein
MLAGITSEGVMPDVRNMLGSVPSKEHMLQSLDDVLHRDPSVSCGVLRRSCVPPSRASSGPNVARRFARRSRHEHFKSRHSSATRWEVGPGDRGGWLQRRHRHAQFLKQFPTCRCTASSRTRERASGSSRRVTEACGSIPTAVGNKDGVTSFYPSKGMPAPLPKAEAERWQHACLTAGTCPGRSTGRRTTCGSIRGACSGRAGQVPIVKLDTWKRVTRDIVGSTSCGPTCREPRKI